MRILKDLKEGLEVFDALNSEMRIKIIKLLNAQHKMSISNIAKHFNISISTLNPHLKKLENANHRNPRLQQQISDQDLQFG